MNEPLLPPSEYRTEASWDGDGVLCDLAGNVLLRFRSTERRSWPLGAAPPFTVLDMNGREVLTFSCRKRIPRGVFEITRSGRRVGEIRQLTWLFTRYAVKFDDGERLTFRFPHFKVHFGGVAGSGAAVQIRMWTHRSWLARVEHGVDGPRTAALVAFFHRERLRHG